MWADFACGMQRTHHTGSRIICNCTIDLGSPCSICVAKLLPTALYVAMVMSISPQFYITVKHLGYFNHILRFSQLCQYDLEMIQTRFLESLLKSFLFSFRRPIWLHSWRFYHNHATKELLQEQMCKIKETTNLSLQKY